MCTIEKIVINSEVLYKELRKMAESRIHTEKEMIMKIYGNIEDNTWTSPYFNLIDELEKHHLPLEWKLGVLAHLKAHITRKKAKIDWLWQIIGIITSLVALLISIVALTNTSTSCLQNINIWLAVIATIVFVIALIAGISGIVRACEYSTDQYVLSIVESVESYYLNSESGQQVKDTKEGPSVPDTDKT